MVTLVGGQDRADLDFALVVPGGVDVVALSFVQKAADVQELKDIVNGRCRVRDPRDALTSCVYGCARTPFTLIALKVGNEELCGSRSECLGA